MTLQLSVGKVRVGFQYLTDKRGRRITKFVVADHETSEPIVEGSAKCAKMDVFHKSVGRLVAMRDALNPLSLGDRYRLDDYCKLPKADRTALYEWYFDNHRFDYDAKGRQRA